MRLHLFILVALLLCVTLIPAQTKYYYCPDNIATTGGSNVIPFGTGSGTTWTNQRSQNLIKASYLSGKPGLIRSIAFVPSGTWNLGFKALVIRIGHNTSGVLSTNFATSTVGPVHTVINQLNFNWNVTADTFNRIPVSRPILYNGKDNLVIDILAAGSDYGGTHSGFRTGSEPRVYGYRYADPTYPTLYGSACKGATAAAPVISSLSYPVMGATIFDLGLTSAPAMAGAALVLGPSKTSFAGLPLPFDLGAIGATGCFLNTSVLFMFTGTVDAQGEHKVALQIPAEPTLKGLNMFSQYLVLHPASPGGLIATQGLSFIIDEPFTTATGSSSTAGLKMEVGMF